MPPHSGLPLLPSARHAGGKMRQCRTPPSDEATASQARAAVTRFCGMAERCPLRSHFTALQAVRKDKAGAVT
jgi:hypothetical protein